MAYFILIQEAQLYRQYSREGVRCLVYDYMVHNNSLCKALRGLCNSIASRHSCEGLFVDIQMSCNVDVIVFSCNVAKKVCLLKRS